MASDKEQRVPLGMREVYPHASDLIAQGLKEQGTEVAFGVHGGDLWGELDHISRAGIRLITMHHEASGVYAAEGYSKVTGKVGVFFADVGPGIMNSASAIQQAKLSCSPLFGFAGGTPLGRERSFTLQPSYPSEAFKPITKWTQYISILPQMKRYISKAFKDAQTYPKGPCVIEFNTAVFNTSRPEKVPVALYRENWLGEDTGKGIPSPGGAPQLVEKTVRMIAEARNPVILAGDGVHWSGAGAELVEFAELAQVPVCGRRIGRGAMPETHPMHFNSRIHRQVIPECDLIVLIGMKVGYFDSDYGRGWPRCIQINESSEHIYEFLNTELAVLGGPKVVLQQMIECMKANRVAVHDERNEWTSKVRQLNKEGDERLQARAMKYKDNSPVHHGYLCKVMWDTCEELYDGMNRIVVDGFTISGFIPPFPKARYSAQLTDASEQGGVGHGVGMAIGAAIADPETYKRPVISVMGDSGMGELGFDIETAVRYELPIVYVVTNNDGWLTGMKYQYYGKDWQVMGPQDRKYGQAFQPKLRYDKLSEVFGCNGEYVEKPNELRPALERALRAAEQGKPTVVNVIVEPTIINPVTNGPGYASAWAHIPWDELPKRGKAVRRNFLPSLPWDEAGVPPIPTPDSWDPVPEEDWEP